MRENKAKQYKFRKLYRKSKRKISTLFKWIFSSTGLQVITAILTLYLTILTYQVAKTTYDYAVLNFELAPKFDFCDNKLMLRNPNPELFYISEVNIYGYDEYLIDGSSIIISAFSYERDAIDEDTPDMNKLEINLNELWQYNGETIDLTEFKELYKDKMFDLKSEYDMKLLNRIYEVDIRYTNLKNYNSDRLTLDIYLNESKDGIDRIIPSERLTATTPTAFLVDAYYNEDFGDEWQMLLKKINRIVED